MAKWYRQHVGYVNAALITIIGIMVGFLSILSLASSEEAKKWHAHPVQFFFGRLATLMLISAMFTGILAGLNLLYNLVYRLHKPRPWHTNLVPVILLCFLVTLILSILGTLILLS